MKLFIWEGDGVLTDYSDGMICAIAPDLESALNAIKEKEEWDFTHCFPAQPTEVIEITKDTKPNAWVVWGGG